MAWVVAAEADENESPTPRDQAIETRNLLRAANASFDEGEISHALELTDSILAGDASHPDASYLKSRILLAQGDSVAAVNVLEAACQQTPRSTRLKLLLARIHLNRGQWEEPLALTESVLAIKPFEGEASYLRGWGLLLRGDTTEAVDIFETVLNKKLNGGNR
jgi:tetratricopeptide (TPR) repeat protein